MSSLISEQTVTLSGISVNVLIMNVPYGYCSMGFHKQRKVKDRYVWYDAPHKLDDLLIATGHDFNKIDWAVPQDWWNKYYEQHNAAPWACWSYENNAIFGEPLFINTLYEELEYKITEAIGPAVDRKA